MSPMIRAFTRARVYVSVYACALGLASAACSGDKSVGIVTPPDGSGDVSLTLQPMASGLTAPVYLTAPAGDARQFVVEQSGRIRIIQNGTLLSTPFLDIQSLVRFQGERGLLSVAFHPNYASNGYFYVNYISSDDGDTHIDRFTVRTDTPNVANPASRYPILTVPQPTTTTNHKGGLVLFGPDGYLYIGMGEGGISSNAQSTSTMLGKMLRIDVNAGTPYTVPPTNPYSTSLTIPREIWALGLRNPWRFTIDTATQRLYIADVGQSQFEEVNVVPLARANVNYGWDIMEGTNCYGSSTCDQTGLERPIFTYDHSAGCSITGGFVYRGSAIPELLGHYFYADYCNGWVKSFLYNGTSVTKQKQWPFGAIGNVLSFGQDASGELYVLTSGGTVYKIVRST